MYVGGWGWGRWIDGWMDGWFLLCPANLSTDSDTSSQIKTGVNSTRAPPFLLWRSRTQKSIPESWCSRVPVAFTVASENMSQELGAYQREHGSSLLTTQTWFQNSVCGTKNREKILLKDFQDVNNHLQIFKFFRRKSAIFTYEYSWALISKHFVQSFQFSR